jgi:flagellar protein FliS
MNAYQTRSIEGLSGVELTIALYDGIIRFLYQAIAAVENGDAGARRAAVKRAMDILIYLQAALRTDVGGQPAAALGEFYVAMFALILQGSQRASAEKFRKAIEFVRNVREAWRQVVNEQAGNGGQAEVRPDRNAAMASIPQVFQGEAEGDRRANWMA